MKKQILITGGNGFLGHNLVKMLISEFNVCVLESSNCNFTRLSDIKENFIKYRYRIDDLNSIFQKKTIHYILHTATDYGNDKDNSFVATTNLIMPLELLEAALKYKVECFINTDTVLNRLVSEYALSKSQFKEWLIMKRNEIKVINIQLEHFYGPDAGDNNFISFLIKRLLNNEPEIQLTLGEQERNFVYYEDVVDAFKLIISQIDKLPCYSNFHVCSDETISVKNLVELIKKLTNSNSKLKFGALPYRKNELMKSIIDNSKLIELGWRPKNNLKSGLEKVIEFEKNKFKI
ncbi:MAG TPA: NAD-dependent epimerase/dehydratase family protein [Bacteroidales bacterium]|nr:NAD-dependent epimerase/dehydratase family protein [Bacteroidales bacterium]